MPFILPELPYAKDALAPVISAETIDYHYGKHHQTYVTNLNNLLPGSPYEGQELDQIVRASHGKLSEKPVFNNAAQVWNHTFYWNSLSPKGGGDPHGPIATAIDASFGSFASFKEKFAKAAATQFGSGWAWLVKNADGGLAIAQTANADTPMATGTICLLTIDVWEHAYYVDYRNARVKYIEEFWKLVNWDFASTNLIGPA